MFKCKPSGLRLNKRLGNGVGVVGRTVAPVDRDDDDEGVEDGVATPALVVETASLR